MGSVFFVGWELWEEMTFVLAMGIVVVFFAGLFKLWWTNRMVKKQEIIDEEKRARLTTMRKTGLQTKRGSDIPFGVRALQNGVEVDGIWVSRPGTPSRTSPKLKSGPSSPTIMIEFDEKGRARMKHRPEDPRTQSISGSTLGKLGPQRTPSSGLSTLDSSLGSDSLETQSTLSMPLPQISEDHAFPSHNRSAGTLNEEALRRLEGQTSSRPPPQLATYIPNSRFSSPNSSISRNHYRPSNRSSTSSSESMSSAESARGPSSTSSQRSYMGRPGPDGRAAYYTTAPQAAPEKDPRPYYDPQRSPRRFSMVASNHSANSSRTTRQSASHSPLLPPQPNIPMPQPTFGPGDTYANRTTRKVNPGFEVLPAGTFGSPQDLGNSSTENADDEADDDGQPISRSRLRKKSSQTLGKQTHL